MAPEEYWRWRVSNARSEEEVAKLMTKLVRQASLYRWAREELHKILNDDEFKVNTEDEKNE